MNCSVQNCDKKIYAKGWCRQHYRHVVEGGHEQPLPVPPSNCQCGKPLSTKASSKDMCRNCYYLNWFANNVDSQKVYKSRYRLENKEKLKKQQSDWRKNNRHKQNAWYAKKRKDPQYRLAHNLRSRLYDFLKGRTKHKSTEELTGCSFEELKKHLESQFTINMTWENYGSYWSVDHIVPLISIDLDDKIGLEQLSHYSNLRPVTIAENSSKAAQDKLCKKNS
jgi:hypothetical protein